MGAVAEVLKAVEGVELISLVEEYLSPPVRTLFALNAVAWSTSSGASFKSAQEGQRGNTHLPSRFFFPVYSMRWGIGGEKVSLGLGWIF